VQIPSNFMLISGVITATLITIFFTYRKLKSKQFVKCGRIQKLTIYPIKAVPGIDVNELELTSLGLKYGNFRDRGFMVVNANNKMQALLNERKLIFIQLRIDDDKLILSDSRAQHDVVTVQFKHQVTESDKMFSAELFEATVQCVDCGDEVANWLERVLDNHLGLRLVQYVDGLNTRPTYSKGKFSREIEQEHQIVFQNKASVMIANDKSLHDLNDRIKISSGPDEQVPMKNFKPNLVITDTLKAWDEDNWTVVTFNYDGNKQDKQLKLLMVNRCDRCPQTTISRDDATMGKEPLQTLRKFRTSKNKDEMERFGRKVFFGTLYVVQSTGKIVIGDQLYAIKN